MADRYRCAVTSREQGEDVAGTASTVRRWVVVEQPGPWGADAIAESGLDQDVAVALRAAARRARSRVLLIRRAVSGPTRRAFVAFSGPGGAWLERHDIAEPEDLLALDLSGLGPDGTSGGLPVTAPLVLTCTNGRHDACCAEFGRPTAAALEAQLPDAAWEVSHIGGDRFAPNVLVLPDGLYYGRVTVADAPELVSAIGKGRVWLPGYRGRSVHPFPVQAAEAELRRARRADDLDGTRVVRWEADGPSTTVHLEVAGEPWRVHVDTSPHEEAWPLTCSATRAASPPVHRITAIEPGQP